VDFGRNSRVLTFLLGGLNFQIEHHLFPRVCHVHYPALSRIVEHTCREYGVRYAAHPSFVGGIVSHYWWLKRMGRPEPKTPAQVG
jgi:linoleoyl-CoA desaturase